MMDTATAIKEAVTCQQFADYIGLKINRSGFAVCPFHGDKDASLKIYKGGRGWCCFGCHKGGDVINFASLYYGLGFKDTLQRLNDDFNLGIVQESTETPQNRVLTAVEIAKRKAERKKEERLKAALEAQYWLLFDKWRKYDTILAEQAPKGIGDELLPDFVDALIHKEEAYNDLMYAEMERLNHDTAK